MDNNTPDNGAARKVPLAAGQRSPFSWPWGLVAIGVMALAWVGLYLVWNGITFVLGM
ncbi:MAG: hypothetical protein P0Y65_06015 [Candidatus Devosia phytovorans]|uniref:Uncharacterized protein n=1 Tax=Candidatus Devosia phytovorans TaxID=3121372 RepID=A0AAJ6B0J7_9HYPH|nr:hypothetical protein [Devosia sp.]WEK05810.1 MAG: hypothetical protein P0Y65_06015 [Devosia sp.]